MTTDEALLEAYALHGDEAAFEELVARHGRWVFSSAYRQLQDRQLAEDATQAVFILLCKRARRWRQGRRVAGWLFATTRYTVRSIYRARARRQRHERAAMQARAATQPAGDATDSAALAGLLDAAVARLPARERSAVVLRFYRGLPFDQVAEAERISEAAARKRVTRAVLRLRKQMGMAGATASAIAAAAGALPGGIAHGAICQTAMAVHQGAAPTAGVAAATHGAISMMTMAQLKAAAVAAAICLLALGSAAAVIAQMQQPPPPKPATPVLAAPLPPAPTDPPGPAPAAPADPAPPAPPAPANGAAPGNAVVLELDAPYRAVSWEGNERTGSMAMADGKPQFFAHERDQRNIWLHYLDIPVDSTRFPILVMSYRAEHQSAMRDGKYVIFLDDTTGPMSGGLYVIRARELVADGNVHEIRKDLRTLKPKGPIIGMAIGLSCGDQGPGMLELQGLRFEAAPDAAPLEAPLEDKAATILVVDDKGKPVADAAVTLDAERSNYARAGKTDAEGVATITPYKNQVNTHMVRVERDGFPLIEMNSLTVGTEPFRVQVFPGVTYTGLVKDDKGKPIEGAKVEVILVNHGGRAARYKIGTVATTNTLGRWTASPLPDLGDKTVVALRVSDDDLVSDTEYAEADKKALITGEATRVLARGLALSGKVLTLDGKPISGAEITLGSNNRWGAQYPNVITDQDGVFKYKPIKPVEDLLLTVQTSGFSPEIKHVPAMLDSPPVEVRLGRAKRLKVLVLDPDGNPIEGAQFFARTWRGERTLEWDQATGKDGRVNWADAPADAVTYDISFKKDFVDLPNYSITATDQDVVVTPKLAQAVEGSVTDAKTGEPIKVFKAIPGGGSRATTRPATTAPSEEKPQWMAWQAVKGSDGKYRLTFRGQLPTEFVRIEAEGYRAAESRAITNDEKNPAVIDFKLEPAEKLTGIVRSADGKPLAGAEVMIDTATIRPYIRNGQLINSVPLVKTDGDGRYAIWPPDADYFLIVRHDQGIAFVSGKKLAESADITLQPWARIEGVARIGDKPAGGDSIEIQGAENKSGQHNWEDITTCDDKGQFHFDHVPPGLLNLQRSVAAGRETNHLMRMEPLTVAPGQTAQITLGGSGRTVIGKGEIPEKFKEAVIKAGNPASQIRMSVFVRAHDQVVMPIPDSVFAMNDKDRADWRKAWLKSDEGKAYLAEVKKAAATPTNFFMVLQPDGTFRVDDVPAGIYEAQVQFESPSPSRTMTATGFHGFTITADDAAGHLPPLDLGTIDIAAAKPPEAGDDAPAFSGRTLEGKPMALADYRGKYVLLVFWSLDQSDPLARIKEATDAFGKNERLVILGLNVSDPAEHIKKFAANRNLPWTLAMVNDWRGLRSSFRLRSAPAIFLIGPDGKIIARDMEADAVKPALEKELTAPK